ncbi:hypothetical protein G9A89_014819 [Geosiphon pyriformis]|nr:hypothetical protein G9A89_014819 [Geosiphon pyriformis]
MSATTVVSKAISKLIYLPAHDVTANLSTTSISTIGHLPTTATSNLSTTTLNNLLAATPNPKAKNNTTKLEISNDSSPTNSQFINTTIWISSNFQHYLSLLITPENAIFYNSEANQQPALTSNIPPATITNDKTLAAIFPFELEETTTVSLFSRAALEEKPITIMYTNAKVDGHPIKLILNSKSAGSIITRQLMDQLGRRVDQVISARIITTNGATKTLIGKIDDFPIEVNGIIIPIKVLVMEATQYQVLVSNNWLTKTNAILNWTTQDHIPVPLINLEKEKPKPTWKAYQVSWANVDHNKLLPILSWDDNKKGKQREKLTWETDDLTDNDENEPIPNWEWKEENDKGKKKEKEKEKETTTTNTTSFNFYTYTTLLQSTYSHVMTMTRNMQQQLNSTATHNNQPCLTCGETLLDKGMWNDIPEQEKMCNELCQYTILISDWIRKRTLIKAVWKRAVQQLDNKEPAINLLEPEKFHEHYQTLALTREKQEKCLTQLNTRLCNHCLIPCDFQYCNECDLIYNPPPRMIYMISEEEKPISSCASELESVFNPDSNSDNDNDKNTGSSSVQNDNKNISNWDSDSNPEIYIVLPDLTKEQTLK